MFSLSSQARFLTKNSFPNTVRTAQQSDKIFSYIRKASTETPLQPRRLTLIKTAGLSFSTKALTRIIRELPKPSHSVKYQFARQPARRNNSKKSGSKLFSYFRDYLLPDTCFLSNLLSSFCDSPYSVSISPSQLLIPPNSTILVYPSFVSFAEASLLLLPLLQYTKIT